LLVEKVRELMLKTRLFGIVAAIAVTVIGVTPVTAFAAETDTGTMTLSEKDKDHKGSRALFEEKVNEAIKKWNTLSTDQKNEVYTLLDEERKAQDKVLDKLAELGVMDKKDTERMKSRRADHMKKLKESGDFPLLRQRGRKCK
jgi:ribosomal protein S20